MISSATGSQAHLLPLRPLTAPATAHDKVGEASGRRRTAPANSVRGLGPGVPRSLLDLSTLAGLGRQAASEGDAAAAPSSTAAPGPELKPEQDREVDELERADAEIRRHEAAHTSAGGRYAGAPSFEYQVGPDGKRYAVAGEVPIDVSPVAGDPRATIAKMQVVKRAANAPASPSAQDRAVAATAAKVEAQARAELQSERAEATAGEGGAATPGAEAATPHQGSRQPGAAEPHSARPVSGAKDDSAPPANRLSEVVAGRYAETASIVGEVRAPVGVADVSSAVATPRFERFA